MATRHNVGRLMQLWRTESAVPNFFGCSRLLHSKHCKLINLKPHLDSKRSDKCNTNLEGTELGSGSTLVPVQTLVRPFGACTQVWTGTRVDTRPRSPLLVGIVYLFWPIAIQLCCDSTQETTAFRLHQG